MNIKKSKGGREGWRRWGVLTAAGLGQIAMAPFWVTLGPIASIVHE